MAQKKLRELVTANNNRAQKEKTTVKKKQLQTILTEIQPATKHMAPTSHVDLSLSYCTLSRLSSF